MTPPALTSPELVSLQTRAATLAKAVVNVERDAREAAKGLYALSLDFARTRPGVAFFDWLEGLPDDGRIPRGTASRYVSAGFALERRVDEGLEKPASQGELVSAARALRHGVTVAEAREAIREKRIHRVAEAAEHAGTVRIRVPLAVEGTDAAAVVRARDLYARAHGGEVLEDGECRAVVYGAFLRLEEGVVLEWLRGEGA